MASEELTPVTVQALNYIEQGLSFVVDGGAGSGKTFTLTQVVETVLGLGSDFRVACITYTNAAADEINSRYQSPRLSVSTIHQFLWSFVSRFQRELRITLLKLIEENKDDKLFALPDSSISITDIDKSIPEHIEYQDNPRLLKGAVSHDQMLVLACTMIEEYPKLSRLIADVYPVILVDEYQDTSPLVTKVLLDSVVNGHRCVVGFFGDHMQAIYDNGVGSLLPRVNAGDLKQMRIEKNRRNSKAVLEFANKLRFDFNQVPSDDADAPNMLNGKQIEGSVHIVMGTAEDGIKHIRKSCLCADWIDDAQEAWLTRRAIAGEVGFGRLLELHSGKDPILAYIAKLRKEYPELMQSDVTLDEVVNDRSLTKTAKVRGLQSHSRQPSFNYPAMWEAAKSYPIKGFFGLGLSADNLFANPDSNGMAPNWCPVLRYARRLCWIIDACKSGDYYHLGKLVQVEINSVADKERLNETIKSITDDDSLLLGQALERAFIGGLMYEGDDLVRYNKLHGYIYHELLHIPITEYQSFFYYYDGDVNYSTQHKTKGLEYQNVIVSLSNGGWYRYNFQKVLNLSPSELAEEMQKENPDAVTVRTAHLLYVISTRAMKNLILYLDTSKGTFDRKTLLNWFSEEQIVNLTDL